MSWQQKFKKQIGAQQLAEVQQLRFNNLLISKLPDEFIQEIAKCSNLQTLSLNQCGIRSLENFTIMPSVTHLEYLDNFTTSKTISQIAAVFPNLNSLLAGGNMLKELSDIDSLQHLKNLDNLNIMSGINKPDSEVRKYVFNKIPSLRILDEKDINGKLQLKQKLEKKQAEIETEANMEEEEISPSLSDSAICSDDSKQCEESESEQDDDSDLSDFIEKKVKDE